MTETPISRFPIPEMTMLPADIRQRIEAVQEKAGFIPNVFLGLAGREAEFRAFFDYHDALMEGESGLSKAEREMIVVATSAANDCLYCVIAHGAVLRIRSSNPRLADQLATNYRLAEITPRQRAMLDFAVKLATHSATVDATDYKTLESHGFSQDDCWDIAAITAFFAMSNRLASMMALMPNHEFYNMARNPREKE